MVAACKSSSSLSATSCTCLCDYPSSHIKYSTTTSRLSLRKHPQSQAAGGGFSVSRTQTNLSSPHCPVPQCDMPTPFEESTDPIRYHTTSGLLRWESDGFLTLTSSTDLYPLAGSTQSRLRLLRRWSAQTCSMIMLYHSVSPRVLSVYLSCLSDAFASEIENWELEMLTIDTHSADGFLWQVQCYRLIV